MHLLASLCRRLTRVLSAVVSVPTVESFVETRSPLPLLRCPRSVPAGNARSMDGSVARIYPWL